MCYLLSLKCRTKVLDHSSLVFFQRDDPKQNGVKLLTPVSDLVFNALSDSTIHFALYGSSLNQNLIGWNNSNSQSESFVLVVLKAAMERKKKGTIWKSNENWVRNWCQKWHTILFTATNRENKQWWVFLILDALFTLIGIDLLFCTRFTSHPRPTSFVVVAKNYAKSRRNL